MPIFTYETISFANTKMRMIAFFFAVFVPSDPAAAQDWKEYDYPGYSVIVSFPAAPKIETTTFQTADGRSVGAHVYSVTQDNAVLKITVVDLLGAAIGESALIENAIKTVSREGEIKVDISTSINRIYGRQLSIVGADGSRSSVALFYHKERLYQIEGKVLPAGNDAAFYVVRFQESLDFTGGESNRPDAAYLANSSDLNPIEQAFATLKALVRTAAEQTIPCLWRRIRHYMSGAQSTANGSSDHIIADYTKSIPKSVHAYNNRADLYRRRGDFEHAIADFNEAIRLDPKNPVVYNNRGVAYQAKDDIDRAIADFSKAIRLDPKFALAYNNRGLAKRAIGDAAGAISDIATAKRMDSHVGIVWICHCEFEFLL